MIKAASTADVNELVDRLETGMQGLYESEPYKAYLQTMSRFHTYSPRNVMLLYLQKPEATLVAGFQKWKHEFERHVKKGEKGLRILAPDPVVMMKETEKLDPDTGRPLLDAEGKPILETAKVIIPHFKSVAVYDVSQTSGKPLPELVGNLSGDVQDYALMMEALQSVSPLPVTIKELPEGTDGKCVPGDGIFLREGMSEAGTVSVLIHEIAHAMLHGKDSHEKSLATDRAGREVEAESIAYVVGQHYGIDTSSASFGYLATWAKDTNKLKSSLGVIQKTAASIIGGVDKSLRLLQQKQEKNISATEHSQTDDADLSVLKVSEKNQKQYDPGFGHMGNGISVWNRSVEKNGDYQTIAHIAPDRSVTIYDKDMPDNIKEQIEKVAKTSDARVSSSQPEKHVFQTPPQSSQSRLSPDPTIDASEMNRYGYNYDGMLPLRRESALRLFEEDYAIYALHQDGGESMLLGKEEIEKHPGLFGVEKEDWLGRGKEEILEEKQSTETTLDPKESALLFGEESMFGLYQLADDAEKDLQLASMEELEKLGKTVDRKNYKLVYTARLPLEDKKISLPYIYKLFNRTPPKDFTGKPLTMGDVILLQWQGRIGAHYTDIRGFIELPRFTGRESPLPDKPAPSKTIPALASDKKENPKPSLLGRLEGYRKEIAEGSKKKSEARETPKTSEK